MLTRLATVLVLLAVAALASPPAMAAVRDYYFAQAAKKGLTRNSVTAFAQDARGFIWVGTQGGLHRYDGQRYIPYRHDPSDVGSLPDNFVTALAPAGERTLWIGTYSQYAGLPQAQDRQGIH
ncbi:MAG: hypothetical protein H0T88_05455 [Lysobacter sp.]|nr:hypothetical protein [Lysobacter sp.]